jgi:hypothetical protein
MTNYLGYATSVLWERLKGKLEEIGDEVFHTGAKIHRIKPDGYAGNHPVFRESKLGNLKRDNFPVMAFHTDNEICPPMFSNDPRLVKDLASRASAMKMATHKLFFKPYCEDVEGENYYMLDWVKG